MFNSCIQTLTLVV